MKTRSIYLLFSLLGLTSSGFAADFGKNDITVCAREKLISQAGDFYEKRLSALWRIIDQQSADPVTFAGLLTNLRERLNKVEVTIHSIEESKDTGDGSFEFKATGVAKFPDWSSEVSSTPFDIHGRATQSNGAWLCEDAKLFY